MRCPLPPFQGCLCLSTLLLLCYDGTFNTWSGIVSGLVTLGTQTEETYWKPAAMSTPPSQPPLHWGPNWQQIHGMLCCCLSLGLKLPGFISFGILTHRQRGYQCMQCISPIVQKKNKKMTGVNGTNLMFKTWYSTGLSLPVCQCQQRFDCVNQLWFFQVAKAGITCNTD